MCNVPKYGKTPWLDYRCKVRLLGYPAHLLVANKLVPFDSKQCSQAPLIKSISPACIHLGARRIGVSVLETVNSLMQPEHMCLKLLHLKILDFKEFHGSVHFSQKTTNFTECVSCEIMNCVGPYLWQNRNFCILFVYLIVYLLWHHIGRQIYHYMVLMWKRCVL